MYIYILKASAFWCSTRGAGTSHNFHKSEQNESCQFRADFCDLMHLFCFVWSQLLPFSFFFWRAEFCFFWSRLLRADFFHTENFGKLLFDRARSPGINSQTPALQALFVFNLVASWLLRGWLRRISWESRGLTCENFVAIWRFCKLTFEGEIQKMSLTSAL